MGRLDDAAKRKVVELRKAGLSFRKIKAVLELDNIKVSAQAIYLFLREFQGRAPGRVQLQEAASSTVPPQVLAGAGVGPGVGPGGRREGWSNIQLQNLLREASHHAGMAAVTEFSKQNTTTLETSTQPSGSGEVSAGSRPEKQQKGNKEDDIQIISVTSLAQNRQLSGIQSTGAGVGPATLTSSGVTMPGAFMRRRVTASPAANPILAAARKRLLDKALSQRTKSFQQVASLLRRDQSGVPGADLRGAMPRQPETYDLTTDTTTTAGQPGGGAGGAPRRFVQQLRPGLAAVRSPHPVPRVGIRLPNRAPPLLTSQATGGAINIRLQNPGGGGGQGPVRRDGNHPGPPQQQQTVQEVVVGGRGGLQDQIQALGSEMHSLGLSVRMLVQQQCRLEREQVQQTQVQRQILSTLQGLASRLGSCSALQRQQQHDKTPPPPPSLHNNASPSNVPPSYGQNTFTGYSQGAYAQCSQAQQPSYNSIDSLESAVEAFKLPGLSPTGGIMNGFQPSCGNNAESLPLTHSPAVQPSYATAYAQQQQQQHGHQTNLPSYAQSFAPHASYTQPHSQPYRGTESKAPDYPGGGCGSPAGGALQDCSVSTEPDDPDDPQLNIIKVEGP